MKRNSRGEFRRRKENFAGGLLLMIDDIGTGKGSKWPVELLDPLPPTAMIETSPGNFQGIYFFDSLIEDMEEFDALIRAFIQRQFLGVDTGQAGVNRVFRPPAGVNGKPKYAAPDGTPWKVQLTSWNPQYRYSIKEIAKAFSLSLVRKRAIPKDATMALASKAGRIRHFLEIKSMLHSAGWMKRSESDYSGWMQMRCPWTHHHTGGVDNGAAIKIPSQENDWHGGFRCHHGHCEQKGWKDLTEWMNEENAEVLEHVNLHAADYNFYKNKGVSDD
jgi:hypothetical protein